MPSKIKKDRIKLVTEELDEALQKNNADLISQNKSDDLLFTIDRNGSKAMRRRVIQEVLPKAQGVFISNTERRLIQKVLTSKPRQPYARFYSAANDNKTLTDLWDNTTEAGIDGNESTGHTVKKRRLKVAVPGQSYNPSLEDHQNALAEAVALQIKKEETSAELKSASLESFHKIVSSGSVSVYHGVSSDEHRNGDDDSDVDSMDSSSHNSSSAIMTRKKVQSKYTKAQRNRIKARGIAKFTKTIETIEKSILQSIDKLPLILKEIHEKEAEIELRKNILSEAEIETNTLSLGYEDVGTVPLSDEIGGGLREIIPKGVCLSDRAVSMRKSGDLNVKNQRARRAYEKPHGAKRVVWVAKYKYV